MEIDVYPINRSEQDATTQRPAVRDEMRAPRGVLIGLMLSTIFWLALLVIWLAV